nr:helix-turn-helix transcriptional regulator [uncultured Eisenbergiella sp.]
MAGVSYKKLWKLLIDKDMKRTDLTRAAGVSPSVITKLGKNEMVSLQTLVNICVALRCGIGDIVEVRHE